MSGATLSQYISQEPNRPNVVKDCVILIDAQVKSKSGFSGTLIKGAYGMIKTLKKRFVPEVVDGLLDDWIAKLEPFYQTWQRGDSGTFTEFLTSRSEEVAEQLLMVTDDKAEKTKHKRAKKAYLKMRGSAKKNVVDAIPELGKMIERYLKPEA